MSAQIVTVFGGSGFVGRHVVRELAKRGYRVRAAERRPSRAGFLRSMGLPGQVEPVYADITKDEDVARALSGASMAVNLVGILYEGGKQRFDALQAVAPGRIARKAEDAGVRRLVHVSAIGADEDSESAYASSKAAGEKAVLDAFPAAVILRPSIVFGSGDGFFNRFAALAKYSPVLPLLGGGHTKMQPIYVDDVADAVCAALSDTSTSGKTYELGGPTIYSFKELMQIVLHETQRTRLLATVPWPLARLKGRILGMLPAPLLTLDQVKMLETDNVVSEAAMTEGRTAQALGITPKSVEAIVPGYLWMYRRQGQYAHDINRENA